MRTPCASSSAAVISRHRGLAVGADDVDRGEAVLGHPEQRARPPHPLQPEPPAERLAGQQVALEPRRVQPGSAPAPRARPRRRSSFARSASTTSAGALATNPSLASLPSARVDLRRAASRAAPRSAARPASGSTPVRLEHLDAADRGDRLAVVAPSKLDTAPAARPARAGPRRRRRAGSTLAGRHADEVAPAPERRGELDRLRRSPRSAAGVDERRVGLGERVDDQHLGLRSPGR